MVVIDRQGGRARYSRQLAEALPGMRVRTLEETSTVSRYLVSDNTTWLAIHFMQKAEDACLPVALAAMSAKLTREIWMGRFNRYFQGVASAVKPTAGYGSDANRWRDEMLPHLAAADIAHTALRRLK